MKSMNIVIDVRPLLGGRLSGVEIYTLKLIENLLKIDSQNRYLLFSNASKGGIPALQRFRQKNVQILQTRIPNKILNLWIGFFRRPRLDRLISKRIPDFKPDVIFQPDLRPLAVGPRIKKICVVHDLSFHHFPQFFSIKTRLWHRFQDAKNRLKAYDRIICVSNFTKKDLVSSFGFNMAKIRVIHEGIDENFCSNISERQNRQIKNTYNLPDNYFLFLATHEPRKNLQRLVEGFVQFKKNDKKGFKLVLVGRANDRIFAKTRIRENMDIIMTGFIPEEDKPCLFQMAKAFLYPSIYEGFGLPLLEAMRCGTPVITSNTSSMPEICGEAAIYVNPLSVAELTTAMQQILDPHRIKTLREHMAQRIRLFSWEKCARETLELIESI
jgi:glycosyltransferase involved in cell wall biosynthesis